MKCRFWRRSKASDKTTPSTPSRLRRWLKRIVIAAAALLALLIATPIIFIAAYCYGNPDAPPASSTLVSDVPGYQRDESFSYLTLPEWYIVYSAEEHARFIAERSPSDFPFFGAVAQYWQLYCSVCAVTKGEYEFQAGYHVMLAVIGTSYSVEYVLKGLYENTAGALTEAVSSTDTPEDRFGAQLAKEYGAFMHTVPFYEFPYGQKLGQLWRETPFWGPHVIRKWERRAALTTELSVKAVYAWFIRKAVKSTYGEEDLHIYAVVENLPQELPPEVELVRLISDGTTFIRMPRYEAFTQTALPLLAQGMRFREIAGNDEIMLTALCPRNMPLTFEEHELVAAEPILTEPGKVRIVLRVDLASLNEVVTALELSGATMEHLYDY